MSMSASRHAVKCRYAEESKAAPVTGATVTAGGGATLHRIDTEEGGRTRRQPGFVSGGFLPRTIPIELCPDQLSGSPLYLRERRQAWRSRSTRGQKMRCITSLVRKAQYRFLHSTSREENDAVGNKDRCWATTRVER